MNENGTRIVPDPMVTAHRWVELNPGPWFFMVNEAKKAARQGQRFSMKLLAERSRWEWHIERTDPSYALNNSLVAPLARILIDRHPELRPFIELRKSRWDVAA